MLYNHKQCLTALFTRHRSSARGKKASAADDKLACDSIAFAELVSYIEELSYPMWYNSTSLVLNSLEGTLPNV